MPSESKEEEEEEEEEEAEEMDPRIFPRHKEWFHLLKGRPQRHLDSTVPSLCSLCRRAIFSYMFLKQSVGRMKRRRRKKMECNKDQCLINDARVRYIDVS